MPESRGRKRTRATVDGFVMNARLRRTKDRRHLLTFDLRPDDDRLPVCSVALRGDAAKKYATVLKHGAHIRVHAQARSVVYLNAFNIESAAQPNRVRCRRAG